jgi:hypothetical protein
MDDSALYLGAMMREMPSADEAVASYLPLS